MDTKRFIEHVAALTPIDQLPLDWDATGYTSTGFAAEVLSDGFDGWSGDLPDEEEVDTIAELLSPHRGDTLLDVACGYGRHALLLAEENGLNVTGIDLSPALVKKAGQFAGEKGLEARFLASHARDMAWDAEFDHVILAYNSLSVFSPKDVHRVLGSIHRALKPGAKLFLDIDNKPFYTRYGTCYRNWHVSGDALTLQEVYFHYEQSVEVVRDITLAHCKAEPLVFVCFKRIYSAAEVSTLLNEAGFAVRSLYGNWDLIPHSDHSPKIIILAEKEDS